MARANSYNRVATGLVVDGVDVVDFGDGETSIRLIPNAEGSAITTGLDGSSTSFNSDRSGTLEVDLKVTSSSIDQFLQLWEAQKSELARLVTVTYVTGVQTFVTLTGCSISDVGQHGSGGATMQTRTFVFNVQKIIEDINA